MEKIIKCLLLKNGDIIISEDRREVDQNLVNQIVS